MAVKRMTYAERMKWFHEARFGLFIHWGLYAIPGRGEWVMFQERIPKEEYAKLADQFRPKKFEADAWAALAKEAGMKYAVLTTRHHDGFCLFDSQVSDFTSRQDGAPSATSSPSTSPRSEKRASRWGSTTPCSTGVSPATSNRGANTRASAAAMKAQFHDQVRELMTNYGKIDVLWYDGHWVAHGKYAKVDLAEVLAVSSQGQCDGAANSSPTSSSTTAPGSTKTSIRPNST